MDLYTLPVKAEIDGRVYDLHADFRDILEIFGYLNQESLPEFLRWEIALGLFFEQEVEEDHRQQAVDYFQSFLTAGCRETQRPGPQLLSWEQDAPAILADVNRVAGQEIRSLPFVHWWTFLSWFQGIGQGQLSAIVSIRDKLRRGKQLEPWERDFYRENKKTVDLPKKYSARELAERERLEKLLS